MVNIEENRSRIIDIQKCISSISEMPNNIDIKVYGKILKDSLNKLFPDFICNDVLYTNNIDKPVFGIYIKPAGISPYDLKLKFQNYYKWESFKFKSYYLELDSKLFENHQLSPIQITAILLRDINNMNNTKNQDIICDMIIRILCDTDIYWETCSHVNDYIFYYVIENTLRNLTSSFCMDENKNSFDDYSGDFLKLYGLYNPYMTGVGAIKTNMEITPTYPGLLLQWFFNFMKTYSNDDRYLTFMFSNAMESEGSRLAKRSLMVVLENLKTQSIEKMNYYKALTESANTKKKGLIWQMKRNGLKSLEEDLYEYGMRLRNVEDQDDAILLMRQINSRMSILEDYLMEEGLDEKDRQRWENVYKEYGKIRSELSKKTVYNKKMYGIFVDYNALQQMSNSGTFMNTYY